VEELWGRCLAQGRDVAAQVLCHCAGPCGGVFSCFVGGGLGGDGGCASGVVGVCVGEVTDDCFLRAWLGFLGLEANGEGLEGKDKRG